MCEQAQEIQDIKRKFNGQVRYGLEIGDYYLIKRLNEIHILEDGGIGSLDSIWIPRQDQLQEMLDGDFDEKLLKFNKFVYPPILIIKPQIDDLSLEEIRKEWVKIRRDMNLPIIESETKIEFIKCDNKFKSFEQLWLSFVMKEKYNKIWNEEKQEWNTKN